MINDKKLVITKTQYDLIALTEKKYFNELTEDIAFSSSIFMVFGLPTRKLKGHPEHWVKENKFFKLIIQRHPDPKYHIPYGCYARMNQIFIDTEVTKKQTNIIDIGISFGEYVEKIGYTKGYANRALLSQLINYVSSRIIVVPTLLEAGRSAGIQTGISKAWDIYFDYSNPNQLMLQEGKIILNEDYAKYIQKHAVPIDMNILRVFKDNATAIDFIRFLSYRNNNLRKEISFPEEYLFNQIGAEDTNLRRLRNKLNQVLTQLQLYWSVRSGLKDGYFWLKPSPPAILRKRLK